MPNVPAAPPQTTTGLIRQTCFVGTQPIALRVVSSPRPPATAPTTCTPTMHRQARHRPGQPHPHDPAQRRAPQRGHGPIPTLRRLSATPGLTRQGYTGHQHHNTGDSDIGLIYMQARYYLPSLARFASPDPLIPDPANPQALNRYTYVLNNPLIFTDPTGHYACYTHTICADVVTSTAAVARPFTSPFIHFTGTGWSVAEQQQAHLAAARLAGRLAETINTTRLASPHAEPSLSLVPVSAAFLKVFGGRVTLQKHGEGVTCPYGHGCRAWVNDGPPLVNVESGFSLTSHLLIHELFHILDNLLDGAASQALLAAQRADPNFPDRPDLTGESVERWGFADGNFSDWQKSRSGASGEEFADMGIGWTYNQWEATTRGLTAAGQARANFMNVNMTIWLNERVP